MYTRFQIDNRDQSVIMDAMFNDRACRSHCGAPTIPMPRAHPPRARRF
jgi:hypothetical protein